MPAAVQRNAIAAFRHRLTLRQTRRTVPIMFSIELVQASERLSAPGRPRRLTVSISSSPSRMLAATPASGSVPSTAVTLLVLSRFDVNGTAMRDLITTVLSVALLVTAGLLIYRRKLLAFYAARVGELSARRTNRLTLLSGAVLGVLVSISSVG